MEGMRGEGRGGEGSGKERRQGNSYSNYGADCDAGSDAQENPAALGCC